MADKIFTVIIPNQIVSDSILEALYLPKKIRTNFFQDLRRSLQIKIQDSFHNGDYSDSMDNSQSFKSGREVAIEKIIKRNPSWRNRTEDFDLSYCQRYGTTDYSLSALNYLEKGYLRLPALNTLFNAKQLVLGNFDFDIDVGVNPDFRLNICFESGIKAVGYRYEYKKRKKKVHVDVYGLRFDHDFLKHNIDKSYLRCQCNSDDIDYIALPSSYPAFFICRLCAKIYTCSCFKNLYDFDNDVLRHYSYEMKSRSSCDRYFLKKFINHRIKNSICHFCNGEQSTSSNPECSYGGPFSLYGFFYPYINLLRKQRNVDSSDKERDREIENEVRVRFGFPRIGEGWISETNLFYLVKNVFSNHAVIHHYRGKELSGLELDVWIPELKLGIEYQGEQHYKEISHWGGKAGFSRRQENDKKKKLLCKELGYSFVEFKHNEILTNEAVLKKLKPFARNR